MIDDNADLQRYVEARDNQAFRRLVERYAGLVYGTCLRVTGNRHDAEDVTQACFVELARSARTVDRSLPGWLHRLATRRSIDHLRRASTRRRYEQLATVDIDPGIAPEWDRLGPLVDRALDALPDEDRELILAHYLEERSQGELAAERGIHQSTVSRRLEQALERLRATLANQGVSCSLGVLTAGLAVGLRQPLPAGIAIEAGSGALLAMVVGGAIAAVALAIVAAVGAMLLFVHATPPQPPPQPREDPMAMATNADQPRPPRDGILLDGVPPMRYFEDGMNPFTMALRCVLHYQRRDMAYGDLLSRSGASFRMAWNTAEWDSGNMDLSHYGLEPFRRGARAAGFTPRFLVRADSGLVEDAVDVTVADEAAMRQAIRTSLAADMPVLAFGVVGPPEISLITGCENGGHTLVGWSCHQGTPEEPNDVNPADGFEPTGEYRKADWYERTLGIVLLTPGEPADTTSREAALATLRWALAMCQHPQRRDHVFGDAAFAGWAKAMTDDASFPDDEAVLGERQFTVWDGLIMLAERQHAAAFCRARAESLPDVADHLEAAAAAFEAEGKAPEIYQPLGGPQLPTDNLRDPANRRAAAEGIEATRRQHAEAVMYLELACTLPDLAPRYEDRPAWEVLGVEDDAQRLEREDPGYGDIWLNRFMARHDDVAPHSPDKVYYGVHFLDPAKPDGRPITRYVAGMAVAGEAAAPDGWTRRAVPAAHYAVFATNLRDVGHAWDYVFAVWLPASGRTVDTGAPLLDCMPPGTTGPASPMTIWLPVKPE